MAQSRHILCTGGCGYVGSHTVVQLLERGHRVAVLDNGANCNPEKVLGRIAQITQKPKPVFFPYDLTKDKDEVDEMFKMHKFDAVIHFASLKAVGESVEIPLEYYRVNIGGAVNLLRSMTEHGCKTLVFSSSCTVYQSKGKPVGEEDPLGPINPYGRTKLMIEEILKDLSASDGEWAIETLRYFNPVGAHESGLMGEHPRGVPNNLMPFVQQVAAGIRPQLNIFGNDYPTPDGTCIRDYIHVCDLAEGHSAALEYRLDNPGFGAHNLGTGKGTSVNEVVTAFEEACGHKIAVNYVGRRAGDVDMVVGKCDKAEVDFGWKSSHGIQEMCASAWKWQSLNPNGYDDAQRPENGTH